MSVNHYENFPVASILCPPALRPAVAAIYWFARTADDLADEGSASAETRLHELAAEREERSERGDRLRRGILQELRGKAKAAGGDGEHGETLHARLPTPGAQFGRGRWSN